MKKLFLPIAIILAVFVIAGCSTKFNIGAPYKNITVVYGFLDQSDTAHYIRIQKAFLDQNKSAITMSKDPDSSFYSNLDVKIQRISASGARLDTIHLNRVNMDNEGYPKQPGIFFQSPNYAYKFTGLLAAIDSYRLVITNLSTGEVDSANSIVIVDNDSTVFRVDVLERTGSFYLTDLGFATTGANDKHFNVNVGYNQSGLSIPTPDAIEAVLTFNWVDSNSQTHQRTAHSYDYNLGYGLYPSLHYFNPLNTDMYKAIYAGMGVAPANVYRLIDQCDMTVYLTTKDYDNYQQAAATQGLGLTGSEIEPIYTNIKGANTIGLYTAKGVRTGKVRITDDTIDSLTLSPYLAPAHIIGKAY